MTIRASSIARLLLAVFVTALAAEAAFAAAPHGGGLRNPPGFVPRKKGPVGGDGPEQPKAPYPTPDPTGPRPDGPPTGPRGPSGPAVPGPSGGPRTGGIVLTVDPTRWQDWWELNRDPYLRVREALRAPGAVSGSAEFYMGAGRRRAVDTLAPTDAVVRAEVAPRILALLRGDPHRDLETACLMALAKVGQDRADFDIVPVLAERLRDPDQEVRETAALALGLCAADAARGLLASLLLDDDTGRQAVSRQRVEGRVRAFAAYGLAFSVRDAADADARRRVHAALEKVLADERDDRDVRVAAILAAGLLAPDSSDSADRRLRAQALERLRLVWDEDTGPAREVVRCHAATSIARLLVGAGDSALASFHVARFARTVADQDAGHDLRRAAALALGALAASTDEDARLVARDALQAAFRGARDHQTRYFALIALGRLGDDEARSFLLDVLANGQRALERPWAAVALGVLCRSRRDGGVDSTAVAALRAQLDGVRNPEARAAFAIGLGLCGDESAADDLREVLADVESQDEIAGHVCIALALLRDARAIPALRELVRTSDRRPQRLREAAVALGALGDRTAAELLVEGLRDGRPTLAQVASISAGLGLIGDRRSLEPLLRIAEDEAGPDLSRAFAVVAIGQIIERGALPWSVPLAVDLNYRAMVDTLIDGVRGVLDVH